jgi:hypothetical protein
MDRPFIMSNTVACVTALEQWIKRRDFNSYSVSETDDGAVVQLNRGAIKSKGGVINCDGQDALKIAERVVRVQLGWPPEQERTAA